MLTNKPIPNKHLISHCRNNSTKLKIRLFCKKCKYQSNSKIKQYDNIKSLYHHLLYFHSALDKMEYPTRDNCISELQVISDSIEQGVLKQ